MSVTNNSIKIKCNNKELYNFLIQDIRIEAIGSGFVVTINTNPHNACLLYYTHNNRMHIISYIEEFECTVEFPTRIFKSVVESCAYKNVITLRGNPYCDLMDIHLEFTGGDVEEI